MVGVISGGQEANLECRLGNIESNYKIDHVITEISEALSEDALPDNTNRLSTTTTVRGQEGFRIMASGYNVTEPCEKSVV